MGTGTGSVVIDHVATHPTRELTHAWEPGGACGSRNPRLSARCGGKAATTGRQRDPWKGRAPPNHPTGTGTSDEPLAHSETQSPQDG